MNAIVPSSAQPISNAGGYVTTPWQRFFNALVSAPAPIVGSVTLTGSPFSFIAPSSGTVVIDGGTVSLVTLTRGAVTITMGAGPVPVANGDVVEVTYSVAPVLSFIPQ